jgi:hypothetical protein
MCLDCGCGKPNDRHGDERHITMDDVKNAAEASGINESEARQNIIDALQKSSEGSSSS